MIIVDPPEGWRYGFPREYNFKPSRPDLTDGDYDQEYRQWFYDHGYKPSYETWYKHIRWWEDNPDKVESEVS